MNFPYIFYTLWMAFSLAIIFVFLSKKLADQLHIYDNLDTTLTIHKHPVPHLGGVGIFLATFIALMLSFFLILKKK